MHRCFFFFLVLLLIKPDLQAAYEVKGRINLGSDWQPHIFMAAIEKLNDYYRASPDLIINRTVVDSAGNFVLQGDNLPEDHRFYRLYLMKKQNEVYDACLYVGGDDHNFVHVVLNNESKLEILAEPAANAPFGKYEVVGDLPNLLMRELANIVFPSFYFYQIQFPTELRFTETKLHTDLKTFADSCRHPLVALAAVNNTDFDEYFDVDRQFYETFGGKLKKELPNSTYTTNYLRKLKYYANVDQADHSVFLLTLIIVLTLYGLIATGIGIRLYQKLMHFQNQASLQTLKEEKEEVVLTEKLTLKEMEILEMIGEGKSNKEIASALFIELSTVKTHINKIYSKLNISSRREAASLSKKVD